MRDAGGLDKDGSRGVMGGDVGCILKVRPTGFSMGGERREEPRGQRFGSQAGGGWRCLNRDGQDFRLQTTVRSLA